MDWISRGATQSAMGEDTTEILSPNWIQTVGHLLGNYIITHVVEINILNVGSPELRFVWPCFDMARVGTSFVGWDLEIQTKYNAWHCAKNLVINLNFLKTTMLLDCFGLRFLIASPGRDGRET